MIIWRYEPGIAGHISIWILHFWIPENLNIKSLFKMKLFLLILPVSLFSFCIIGCGAPEDEGPEEAPEGTEESLAEETAVE